MPENKKTNPTKKKRPRSTKSSVESTESRDATMSTAIPNIPATPTQIPHQMLYTAAGPVPQALPFARISEYPSPNPVFMTPPSAIPVDLSTKIDFILTKLSTLDVIESHQREIAKRLTTIEAELIENRKSIDGAHKRIQDEEDSQKFISNRYETVATQSEANKALLQKMESDLKDMSERNTNLMRDNGNLEEDVVDLQCRSMRDNLVFTGIPESSRTPQRTDAMETATAPAAGILAQAAATTEDCQAKIFEFCQDVLGIQNPRDRIRIDRAHRMGAPNAGRTRPIVTKFMDTNSKMLVKDTVKTVNMKQTTFNVFDQLPQKVQERRRALVPVMVQARNEGKRAYLVRDKLFINNRQYRPGSN